MKLTTNRIDMVFISPNDSKGIFYLYISVADYILVAVSFCVSFCTFLSSQESVGSILRFT